MEKINLQSHCNTSEFSSSFIFPDSGNQEIINKPIHDEGIALTISEQSNVANDLSPELARVNNAEFSEYPVRSLIFILKKLHLKELFKEHVRDPRRRIGKYSIESLLTVGLSHFLFRSESKNDFYQSRYQGRSYRSLSRLAEIDEKNFPVVKTLDDLFIILNPNDLEPLLFNLFKDLCRKKVFASNKGKGFFLSIDAYCITHLTHRGPYLD